MARCVLGGTVFHVEPMASAWDSFALQPLLGPGVMELFGLMDAVPGVLEMLKEKGGDLDTAELLAIAPRLAETVGRALGKIPPADLDKLTRAMLSQTTVEIGGKTAQLAEVFAVVMKGRTMDTWRLLFYALKENYPDFFGLLGAKGGAKEEVTPSGASAT